MRALPSAAAIALAPAALTACTGLLGLDDWSGAGAGAGSGGAASASTSASTETAGGEGGAGAQGGAGAAGSGAGGSLGSGGDAPGGGGAGGGCAPSDPACGAPTVAWNASFGDASFQAVRAAAGFGDGFVLAGDFLGTIDFGPTSVSNTGGSGVFLATFDASGTNLWSRALRNSDNHRVFGVDSDASLGVAVGGTCKGTQTTGFDDQPIECGVGYGLVSRIDSAGGHQWTRLITPGDAVQVQSVAIEGVGGVFASGIFGGSFTIGMASATSAGGSDAFVVRFGADGIGQWARAFGTVEQDFAQTWDTHVVHDGSSSLYLAFGADKDIAIDDVALTGDGFDVFLAKLAPLTGEVVIAKRYAGIGSQNVRAIAAAPGRVAVVGVNDGSVDFGKGSIDGVQGSYLALFDESLTATLSRSVAEAEEVAAEAVDLADDGSIYVAGRSKGDVLVDGTLLPVGAGVGAVFVIKLDASGELVWASTYPIASGLDRWPSIVAGDGGAYLGGTIDGSIDLGIDAPLTHAGGDDLFVARLEP